MFTSANVMTNLFLPMHNRLGKVSSKSVFKVADNMKTVINSWMCRSCLFCGVGQH